MTDEQLGGHREAEVPLLVETMRYLRRSFSRNLDGLSDEQLRHEGVPSGTSLLGLADHLARVEAIWIVFVFEGSDESIPSGAVSLDDRTLDAVMADWETYGARTDAAVLATDLDRLSARPTTDDGPVSLRWIMVHLIEETARHAGHADILREQIDGAVGR